MPLQFLFAASFVIVAGALWLRRKSYGFPNEGAPTLLTLSAGAWLFLSSPQARDLIADPAYSVFRVGYLEILLSNCAAILFACTGLYMFLMRFYQGRELQAIFSAWVLRPMGVVGPLMVALHMLAVADLGGGPPHQNIAEYLQEADYPGVWVVAYWLLMIFVMMYLVGCSLRVLTRLRIEDWGQSASYNKVLNMYLAALWMTMWTLALHFVDVAAPLNLSVPAMGMSYVCVVLWVSAAAYAWRSKTKLKIDREWDNGMEELDPEDHRSDSGEAA